MLAWAWLSADQMSTSVTQTLICDTSLHTAAIAMYQVRQAIFSWSADLRQHWDTIKSVLHACERMLPKSPAGMLTLHWSGCGLYCCPAVDWKPEDEVKVHLVALDGSKVGLPL